MNDRSSLRAMRGAGCAFLTLMLAPLAAHATGAEGDEKAQCIDASDRGQDLRDSGSFGRAREAFARCARDTCPERLRHDCVQWLVDLDAVYPSLVIVARDEQGKDLEAVAVSVDGVQVVATLDGTPLRVDPGPHHLRYEAEGFVPIEEDVIVRKGEKDRPLHEVFRRVALPSPHSVEPESSPPAAWKPRTLGWVLAGAGAVAFASEAVFGISGANERSSALAPGGCAPHCSPSQTQDIETKFIVADVSLGVGVVSSGLALYFLLRPEAKRWMGATTLGVQPRAGGVVATVGAAFE